ncbi:hypothetical protein BS50DRAFT_651489 [Corynespora cassiicola Philippines]|uniref:Uncharacterized protein n=1 Tax=Corynespora cassiicola Philippines TaxID=1448308 RepID=A0A2T2N7H7_CORCC|nr:hypothetical protein BS50DRAFT_651489 [Corynespora cassiicola Philippines]
MEANACFEPWGLDDIDGWDESVHNGKMDSYFKLLPKFLFKAKVLLSLMKVGNQEAGQILSSNKFSIESPFQEVEDLALWGYQVHLDKDLGASPVAQQALEAIGVSNTMWWMGGQFVQSFVDFNQTFEINGEQIRPVLAEYKQTINPAEGVIIADSNMKMTTAAGASLTPELYYWSDVAFLQWKDVVNNYKFRQPGMQESVLRYVIRANITNKATLDIIEGALSTTDQEATAWPGVTFGMNTREGQALLGSPNGTGVGYLLAQHKRQLGCLTVGSVTVFLEENEGEYCLLFSIAPVA